MKKFTREALCIIIFLLESVAAGFGQIADFSSPDTVCVGNPVTFSNHSTGVSTYDWTFCKADFLADPVIIPVNTVPNMLKQPTFLTVVKDSNDYFVFVTNRGDGSIARIYYQNTLTGPTVSEVNLGNFGFFDSYINGIQICKENGRWYGFTVAHNLVYRLDFGTSLLNTPVVIALGITITLTSNMAGLIMGKEGNQWTGFLTDQNSNSLFRLDWGNSLTNVPNIHTFGLIGNLNVPWQISLIKQDTTWYLFVANEGDSTLSRFQIGNSLFQTPVGQNLGNVGSLDQDRGVIILNDCNDPAGYILNHSSGPDFLTRLSFNGGLGGTVTGNLTSVSGMNNPSTFSNGIWIQDTLCFFIANSGMSDLKLMFFPPCTAAAPVSSTLKDPPQVVYSTPGTYKVRLVTDDGTDSRQEKCKTITVLPELTVSLGNDITSCPGKDVTLDPGPGFSSYLWNTGATSQTIAVDTTGDYWIKVTNKYNCFVYDTIHVRFQSLIQDTARVSICYGSSYFAGGKPQTTSGTYIDTLKTIAGCDSVVTTFLLVKQQIIADLGPDQYICPGDNIVLSVSDSAAVYEWQDGSQDSSFTVTEAGIYWIHVTRDSCMVGDTIDIRPCPAILWFPNAFTPNENGINDVFKPKGLSIASFHMEIFNRWGQLLYATDDIDDGWNGIYKGEYCPAETYSYIVNYEGTDIPGKKRKASGTFILIR
ncbi:MAG: gliding motility-associated C-terminal domain-containing protein [Bacteroidota bacterium]|nr:gliding motility-associated C-terminal domain-containing protein [Bacteroidota bacterium]